MTDLLERPVAASLFGALDRQPADALLAVIGLYRADPRPDKIDVGVGVYRDETGATPVMAAVKQAEALLLAQQDSKSYLGAEGDQRYTDLLARVALREAADARVTGIQTPGGTGALRLAAELIARTSRAPRIWIGLPTWPNHGPIFNEAGLTIQTLAYFDAACSDVDFDAFVDGLSAAATGDIVLLHGCCHNPTGTAFTLDQWRELAVLFERRGLVPLIDLAYQGLGAGREEDAAGTRLMLATVPEALVAYSCDKNFALYRERVGALWVQTATPAATVATRETLLVLARSMWSMPPDHGAAIVRNILEDATLTTIWRTELDGMCARINNLRAGLAAAHPALGFIARQQGLFALLPIDRATVVTLREQHGIYMPDSGRINIAGLRDETISPFVAALSPFLPN